jgi:hypothetical protein
MTDDLSTKLAVLTDARPEPADPAAPIRLRIKRRQRRRRGTAAVLVTAAATAAVLAAGPVLGAVRSGGVEPGVAGFAPPPPSTTPSTTPSGPTTPTPTGDHSTIMPLPWSDEAFTKMPDANAYQPKAYYIAEGEISTESWAVLAFSQYGCMVTDEGPANSFGRPYVCFNKWRPGQRSNYHVVQAHAAEKNATKLDATLVIGAVSAEARMVHVKVGGKTYVTDAVGTPASDRLRFFALVIPKKDVKITSVTPRDGAGWSVDAPTNVPTGMPCGTDCGTATPAK